MSNLITQIGGPTILIFLGGIIAAIGAVWASYEQNTMSDRLDKKNEEIIRLNRDISSSITGGSSFCYITTTRDAQPATMLIHSGDHPIYDVSARIVDLDLFEKVKGRSLTEILSADRSLTLGGMPPSSSRILGQILPTDSDYKRFNIFFSARNGFFTEVLRMKRIANGEWARAIKVTNSPTTGEPKTLFEQVDAEYPRGEDGMVQWD